MCMENNDNDNVYESGEELLRVTTLLVRRLRCRGKDIIKNVFARNLFSWGTRSQGKPKGCFL